MRSTRAILLPSLCLHLGACAAGGGGTTGTALGERVSFEGVSFQVPASWVAETPLSRMRLAQYRVPAADPSAAPGECAVFHFPGTGGSVQANLERWYGQFTQPDGGDTAGRARVETFSASALQVTMVQVTGTYRDTMGPTGGGAPKEGYAMAAGVIETAGGPWFIKCVGPEAGLQATSTDLRSLLQSLAP